MNMPVVAALPVPSVRSTWLYGGVIVGAVDVSQAAVIDVSTKRAATALSENHEPARITTPRERVAGNIDYLTGSRRACRNGCARPRIPRYPALSGSPAER